jgi:hypothetical protein
MFRKGLILLISIFAASSMIYTTYSYTSAEVTSATSLTIADSENAFISMPKEMNISNGEGKEELRGSIRIKNNMSHPITLNSLIATSGTINFKLTDSDTDFVTISNGNEEIVDVIYIPESKAGNDEDGNDTYTLDLIFNFSWIDGSSTIHTNAKIDYKAPERPFKKNADGSEAFSNALSTEELKENE